MSQRSSEVVGSLGLTMPPEPGSRVSMRVDDREPGQPFFLFVDPPTKQVLFYFYFEFFFHFNSEAFCTIHIISCNYLFIWSIFMIIQIGMNHRIKQKKEKKKKWYI